MSKKCKKIHMVLNHIENLVVLVSTITGCVLIYSFPSFIETDIGLAGFAVGLKM